MTQGTIIPPEVDQDSIEYGHVYANYVKSVADTPADDDANPDIVHVNGQVTFDSTFPGASARGSIRLPAEPRAYGLIVTGDTFEIVNSKLVDHEGREGVRLIASVDDIPLSWQAVVTLQDSAGRTIYNKSYIIHHDLWDSSGELLHINLPDLIPTPSRLEPPEGAAVRAAERAIEEIEALTQTNQQVKLDVEGLKSEVVTLHGQTGQRLAAAEAARAAAVTAQGLAEAAQSASETARSQAQTARTGAQTARTGAESARDAAQGHAGDASQSASGAAGSASDASQSASGAAGSASDASGSASAAAGSASDASGSASAAAGSASDASSSASDAAGSASDASSSASDAAGSASDAQTARADAQTARTGAESARDAAAGSASDAAGSASDAAGSASDADESATAAGESASTAAGSATAAGQSATDADQHRQAAEGHATDAATSLSGAEDARDLAQQARSGAEDERIVAQDATSEAEGHAQAADGHRVDAEAAAALAQSLRWVIRGAWESGEYEAGDVVVYDERAYYAQSTTSVEPPAQPWVPLTPAGGGGASHWDDLDGKPSVFPPADHGHDAGDITGEATPSLDVSEASVGDLSVAEALDATTDASRLEGALTDQVDASAAMVELDMSEVGGPPDQQMLLAQWLHSIYLTALDVFSELGSKADVDHTHDGADITGALTDQVDASAAMVGPTPSNPEPMSAAEWMDALENGIAAAINMASSKADADHTHTADELAGALTDQVDASAAEVTLPSDPGVPYGLAQIIDVMGDMANSAVQGLSGKADAEHTHPISDVSGLEDALDDRPTRAEVEARGPAIERVTELPADPDPDTFYVVVEA